MINPFLSWFNLPVQTQKTEEEQEREAVGNYAAAIAKANTELMMFYLQKIKLKP